MAEKFDRKLQYEKASHFKGYARIRFTNMRFSTGRELNEKNIRRLKAIFETEGCHRDDPKNFLPVLIDHELLSAVPGKDFERELSSFQNPSFPINILDLPQDREVQCLHGRHRIMAAKKFLRVKDRWWTVACYIYPLSAELLEHIRLEYSNALKFLDGEIYCCYRVAVKNKQPRAVERWLARLSQTKKRNLLQLEKVYHGQVVQAFDALIPFVGLWQDFHLGSFNRILPLRCYEEVIHYLDIIKKTWSAVLDSFRWSDLDAHTVKTLQLLAPRFSLHDQGLIKNWMREGKIFAKIEGTSGREKILSELLKCGRIVSFYSFFEDTIFLETCHSGLRRLLPNKKSYRKSFRSAFEDYDIYTESFTDRYIRLWLFAMRHFPELSQIPSSQPRTGKNRPEFSFKWSMTDKSKDLTSYAIWLGFLCDDSEDGGISIDKSYSPEVASTEMSCVTTNIENTPLRARCNRPFEDTFIAERARWFLEAIYQKEPESFQRYFTAFGVIQDIVKCFWGLNEPTVFNDSSHRTQSPFEEPVELQASSTAHPPSGNTPDTELRDATMVPRDQQSPASLVISDPMDTDCGGGQTQELSITGSHLHLASPDDSEQGRMVSIQQTPSSLRTVFPTEGVVATLAGPSIPAARKGAGRLTWRSPYQNAIAYAAEHLDPKTSLCVIVAQDQPHMIPHYVAAAGDTQVYRYQGDEGASLRNDLKRVDRSQYRFFNVILDPTTPEQPYRERQVSRPEDAYRGVTVGGAMAIIVIAEKQTANEVGDSNPGNKKQRRLVPEEQEQQHQQD